MFAGYIVVSVHRHGDKGGIRLSFGRSLTCEHLLDDGDSVVAAHAVCVKDDDDMESLRTEIERLNAVYGVDVVVDRLALISCLDEVHQIARDRPIIVYRTA